MDAWMKIVIIINFIKLYCHLMTLNVTCFANTEVFF